MKNLVQKYEDAIATAYHSAQAQEENKVAQNALDTAKTNLAELHRPSFASGQREVHVVGKFAVTIERDSDRGNMIIEIDAIQGEDSVNTE